jgi:hypothetical protein
MIHLWFGLCLLLCIQLSTQLRSSPRFAVSKLRLACSPGPVSEFLTDAQALGPVRFVVVGNGAILETVGSFDNLRYSDSSKGKLATLSTDSPCFEVHIRYANIAEIHNKVISKFEKTLRVTRFIDEDGNTMLSAILNESGDEPVKKW